MQDRSYIRENRERERDDAPVSIFLQHHNFPLRRSQLLLFINIQWIKKNTHKSSNSSSSIVMCR